MVDEVITKQELIDAKRDAHDLGDSVNEKKIIYPRYGAPYRSIPLVVENIENTINEWDAAVKTITQEGGIPDLAVSTWSGRTQADKNKENISAQDYGAEGNGEADDTQAFIDLEATHQGRTVDLLGKTYLVDKTPFKNQYMNGQFKIGNQMVIANKKSFDTTPLPFALNPTVNDSASGLLWGWYLTSTWVAGQDSNAVQTFAVDEKNRLVYSMYTTGTYDTSSVIYATPMDRGSGFTYPVWAADADRRVGHQGMGIENNADGKTYIWATKQTNAGLPETIDPYAGCKVIRFRIDNVPSYSTASSAENEWSDRNGLYFEDVQDFQLWESVATTQNAQATISHDQKYLLTKMNMGSAHYRIRIFDLQTLVQGGAGDYSNKFVHEFIIPTVDTDPIKGVSIQDMACDGKHIYFYAGRNGASDGAVINLTVHDMMGNFVDTIKVGDIGLYDSINYPRPNVEGLGDISETEGITIATINGSPTVLIHFAAGTGGYRPSLIYSLGLKQLNARGDRNTPALMVDNHQGGLSLAFPRYNHVIKFGGIDVDGNQGVNIQFARGNTYLGGVAMADSTPEIPMLSLPAIGNATVNMFGGVSHYRGDDNNAPVRHVTLKSRSADMVTQKPVMHNDYLWELAACGDDGSKPLTESNVGAVGGAINFRVDGTVSTGFIPTRLHFSTASETEIVTSRFNISPQGNFEPSANNLYTIGNASYLVKEIHLGASPIVSSDERLKQQFRSQTQRERGAALDIKASICLYKFSDAVDLKGDGARWHVGVKAQQVISILESHDLDPFEYGFVCFDEWGEQEDQPSGSRYAVRYDELAMFILAAL